MPPRPITRLRLLVLLALGLVAGACKQPDSILFITVYGPTDVTVNQFSVNVSVGDGTTQNILVPNAAASQNIDLPASFTVAIPSSYTGPILVAINANLVHADGTFDTLWAGLTMMTHIHLGGQTDLSVDLSPVQPPGTPDGGAGGGGAGMTGAGGAAGQGGASGADGGGGAEDALDLDAATD
ncbi:MAG TPA: hypothetical protein VHL80_11620 [Polyangia bacterium]|nr:hypothetical protein [Polyangia bacterium]